MCLQGVPGASNRLLAIEDDGTCTGDAAKCCGNCGVAGVGGYGVAKSPAELRVAKMLHEAAREAVKQNLVVRTDVPNNGFIEWDQLADAAREGRFISARFILERYAMLPLDNAAGCSGCRTCTEALDRLDCARRDFIAVLEEARMLRGALAGLIGASEKSELEKMELLMRSMPAPAEDKAAAIDGIHALLKATYSTPGAPVEVDRTHEECAYCARVAAYPPECTGHPGGSARCVCFKGADVC